MFRIPNPSFEDVVHDDQALSVKWFWRVTALSILDEPSLESCPLLVACFFFCGFPPSISLVSSPSLLLAHFSNNNNNTNRKTYRIIRTRAKVNSRKVIQRRARVQRHVAVHERVLDGNLPAGRHALGLHVHLAVGCPVHRVGVLDGEVVEGEGWVVQAAAEPGLRLWASAA